MKVEIELSREQLEDTLHGVLGACFSHWSWWESVKYEDGYDWNIYPTDLEEKFLTVKIADPDHFEDILDDDEEVTTLEKTLSVADILRAWSVLSMKGWTLSDRDSCSSDGVMQTATLGEVVYG